MKKLMTLLFFTSCTHALQAQFIAKGKIEFEKTVNLHKQFEMDDDNNWAAMMKKSTPPHRRTYFELIFDNNKSLYKPGKESPDKLINTWLDGPASENIVYSDLEASINVSHKQVFDESLLIQDSVRIYKWRLTNDTRTIAGFECRRATTIIMDSVFVVAFYTEEIIPPGGPESFQGLPGMILGIVIPRMYTSWYATKVELTEIKHNTIVPPKKGKTINYSGVDKKIDESLKQWGKWGTKYIYQIKI